MDFDFHYAFSDGSPQTNTALVIAGGMGTLTRQVANGAGRAIGLWRGTVTAAAAAALWRELPGAAPPGYPLAPGMPNHFFRAKRAGVEKSVRFANEPELLDKVRPFIQALEEAMKQAEASPLRTVAVAIRKWTTGGLEVELTVAGIEDVTIPDAAEAIRLMSAPAEKRNDLRVAGTAPAGAVRIPAGQTRTLLIAVERQVGMVYQAMYRRYGNTAMAGGEIFGEAGSGMVPR